MAILHETSKTLASALFAGPPASRVVRPTPKPEFKRKRELSAWIAIAIIWGIFALSLYLIWVKALRGF